MSTDTATAILSVLTTATVPASEVVEKTGLSETTVRKALKQLAEEGKVRIDKVGRTTRWSLPLADEDEGKDKGPSEAQQRDAELVAALEANGPLSVTQVAEVLEVKRSLAYVSVWRLAKQGKVVKKETGTRTPVWAVA